MSRDIAKIDKALVEVEKSSNFTNKQNKSVNNYALSLLKLIGYCLFLVWFVLNVGLKGADIIANLIISFKSGAMLYHYPYIL